MIDGAIGEDRPRRPETATTARMFAAMVTVEFEPGGEPMSTGRLPELPVDGGQLPGLRSRIDWRDAPNNRCGSLHVWDSREHAIRYYDDTFMERHERTLGVRPVVRFLEVTAMLNVRQG